MMEFLTACVLTAGIAALLNLWVYRIRPRKPIIPEWVAGLRFQSGRRIMLPDEEPFGVMLEKQDQDKRSRVLVLFSARKSQARRRSDEPGNRP